jgi:hypothetical protein
MSFRAPLRVPVELRRGTRWFRLAHAVSVEGLALGSAAPEAAEGPVEVAFVLPGAADAIRCHGRVEEQVVGGGEPSEDVPAERRAIRFLDLDAQARARIQAYVEERLGLT